jgi:hypothetical protein
LQASKAEKTAKRVCASDLPEIARLPGSSDFDATKFDLRVQYLSRRFLIPRSTAFALADLCFGEVAR